MNLTRRRPFFEDVMWTAPSSSSLLTSRAMAERLHPARLRRIVGSEDVVVRRLPFEFLGSAPPCRVP